MPSSLSSPMIKVIGQEKDIVLLMENVSPYLLIPGFVSKVPNPKVDARIILDYFEAKSLAYSILAKTSHIDKNMLQCNCGRQKITICEWCDTNNEGSINNKES